MERINDLFFDRIDLIKELDAVKHRVVAVPINMNGDQGLEIGKRFGQRNALAAVIALIENTPPHTNERIDNDHMYYYNGYISQSHVIKSIEAYIEEHNTNEPSTFKDPYAQGQYIGYREQMELLRQEINDHHGVTRQQLIAKKEPPLGVYI